MSLCSPRDLSRRKIVSRGPIAPLWCSIGEDRTVGSGVTRLDIIVAPVRCGDVIRQTTVSDGAMPSVGDRSVGHVFSPNRDL